MKEIAAPSAPRARGYRKTGAALCALLAVLALAGCGKARHDVGKPNAEGLIPINVAGSDAMNSATPMFAAMDQGFFRAAGLDVRYTSMSVGATAIAAAMKTGDVDIALGSASQWISDTARGAIRGKIIGEFTDNNYVILARKGITNPAQLAGKIFAISSPDAGDHLYSKAVLAHYGVDPDSVTWLQMGEPTARVTALFAGRIDATEIPLTSLPPAANDYALIRAEDSPVPFVSNAIYARQELLDANRDAVVRFLAAIGKGADWVRANPDKAVASCRKSGGAEEACRNTIAGATTSPNRFTWSSTTAINAKGIEAMIPAIGNAVPQVATIKPEQIMDASLAPAPAPAPAPSPAQTPE
ncbi:ABC transporter substrate-binding protein [Novosphingobium flavum]|uniref:ABC transporter substrate-binding protein n=1 Tax=Novosphingobium flavum TaxID=1778672 RepID=A0A7X1FSN7_9SPHN|nr:ABC transporter substrate-binding protein [Novosphingobium flavum]MBC2666129.1 ABC transporter substrate-binding protein [Novosphingobium flavum]